MGLYVWSDVVKDWGGIAGIAGHSSKHSYFPSAVNEYVCALLNLWFTVAHDLFSFQDIERTFTKEVQAPKQP